MCASDGSSGGDRVDAFNGPDGRLHLLILDICGHGSRAVELADMALYSVRTMLWQCLSPGMVFASLNRLLLDLYGDHRDTSFGSGAIISFNPDRSLVTFASAGHVDVLSFSNDGTTHTHHRSSGPLYGVVEQAEYEERILPYKRGETFVMVTDGLLDVRPTEESTAYLGTTGMCRIAQDALASPGGLSAQRLISVVRRIAGGAFNDDVAALVAGTRAGHVSERPARARRTGVFSVAHTGQFPLR